MNIGGMGEVSGEVVLIADELSHAVELTLNPTVAHEARSQAYNACESFKENSPWCAQAGLLLASGHQYSAVVKHFGLQLMEHTVKYRWTQITQAEKIFIKENAMRLLYMGGWETGHLNDALSRVIVEMVKREWPQQWPTLLAELSDACALGHRHTQVVLHIFLRLVEDVATLQTLEQNQRRKDIYQALTSNMPEIFAFFMRLTETHVLEFRQHTAAGEHAVADSNGRVVQVVLVTLAGFLEWVPVGVAVSGGGALVRAMCALLQDQVFCLPAADCLLQLVNRKGSTKERKPLMMLFSEDAISSIHRAALAFITQTDESTYLFLKKLSQILAGLAQQLTTLWNFATNVDSWLPTLLETMLLLTSHPSLTVTHTANSVWLAFLKHDQISKLPHVITMVPRWLQAAAPKLLKVSYPASRTSNLSDSLAYICMDYDSEQEFAMFFSRCRTEILDSFRFCMVVAPLVTWSYVQQWTTTALDKVEAGPSPSHLDHHHPLYVEWEALSQVLDVVLSRLVQAEPRPNVAEGLRLLQRCVDCTPPSPLLLSLLLSFISALFVFLSCAYSQIAGPGVGVAGAELLPRVLHKVFVSLTYEGSPPDRRAPHVRNLRRHAASLLVKLASKYPLVLLPVFGRLHEMCASAVRGGELSALESVTVHEALLLVSNHLCCFDRQSALVAEVLGDSSARWAALAPLGEDSGALARAIGLDVPPPRDDLDTEQAVTRRTLIHALTLLLGVVKRTQVPADPDKASRGGFSGGVTSSGNPLWRNPCTAHVLPLFPSALGLARALHDLHASGSLHPSQMRALHVPAAERRVLLSLPADHSDYSDSGHDRMQNYIHTLHDNVCHIVGAAAASLGRELYAVPGLARFLQTSVLAGLPSLPDHWLRPLVRAALRPLLHHCPPNHYQQLAIPIIEYIAPIMLSHLSRRWEYIGSLYESGKLEQEAGGESQEVLDDILARNLTREYLELLKVVLMEGCGGAEVGVGSGGGEEMEEDGCVSSRGSDNLSELGSLVVAHPTAGPAVLHTILLALTWNDSGSSLRACSLALPALRGALSAGRVSCGDATGALGAALHALRHHGQHDANQAALLGLALQAYEILVPVYPSVGSVLRAIPEVDAHDLRRLDEKLAAAAAAGRPGKLDKGKRDLFKKITSRLIGRNVGQLFKKEVFILDLPTLQIPKDKPPSAVEAPEGAGLEGLFAPHAPT